MNHLLLNIRHDHVFDTDGDTAAGRVLITHGLDVVEELGCSADTVYADRTGDNISELLLTDYEVALENELVAFLRSIDITEVLRDNFVEDKASQCGLNDSGHRSAVELTCHTDGDRSVELEVMIAICHDRLIYRREDHAFALLARLGDRQIVASEDHILCRNGYRVTILRLQEVVGGQHEESCLRLCLCRERYVYSHLVTVEVGVERGTNERMELDGTAFYEDRLKCLDTESVERRSTVEHNRMILDNVFEDIPYDIGSTLYHSLCCLDVLRMSFEDETLHYERLEELKSHLLRETALVHLQFRSYNDNGTAGIVNTLTEKVLTETALLTFEHVGQGLKSSGGSTCYRTSATAVVDESIDCFLKHSLLVSYDDLRSTQLEELAETVVSVDNTTIEVVEVRCSETAAVELYHRAEFRRKNRENIQDHPLRLVTGLLEALEDLESLDDTGLLLACSGLVVLVELSGQRLDIQFLQQDLNCFRTHHGLESRLAVFLYILVIFHLVDDRALGKACCARIYNDVCTEVQNSLELLRRNIKKQAHTGRCTSEIPDMGYRSSELDVAQTLTTHLGTGNLYAASVADDALITDLLILTAVALPVLGRSEDTLAEKAIALRLERTIIDRFRLFNLTVGPALDGLRRCQANTDRFEMIHFKHIFAISFPTHISSFSMEARSSMLGSSSSAESSISSPSSPTSEKPAAPISLSARESNFIRSSGSGVGRFSSSSAASLSLYSSSPE